MKKNFLLSPVLLVLMYVILSSYANGAGTRGYNRTGATGSTGCYSCHGSSATSGINVTIELDSAGVPVTRYIAGHNYTIKLKGVNNTTSNLPKFGFQLASVSLTGAGTAAAANAGTYGTMPSGCRNTTIGSIHVIEQTTRDAPSIGTGAGSGATTYTENIPWTAPISGSGSIKLFGLINAVNSDGGASGSDKWNGGVDTITEFTAAEITGATAICVGSSTTLTIASAGGVWRSSTPAIASVDSATGVVTSFGVGSTIISFTDSSGTTSSILNVLDTPAAITITGGAAICTGATIPFSASASGGTWSSSNATAATVTAGGVVKGLTAGTTVINYMVSNICGSASANDSVTVYTTPSAGTITGQDSVCPGHVVTLTETVTGGTWMSAATTMATVTATGSVTGVTSGTDYIWYIVNDAHCADTAKFSFYVMCPTAVGEVTALASNMLTVYPNPASGDFSLTVAAPTNELAQVTITSVTGQLVKQMTILTNKPAAVQLAEPAGVYIVTATLPNGRVVERMSITK